MTWLDVIEIISIHSFYGEAFTPEYPGSELFTGEMIHSWQYREPETYKDKTVLLVGAGLSSWDMAFDLSAHVKQVG